MCFALQLKFNFEQPSNICLLFNRPSRFESSDSENDQQEVELNGQQQTRKSPRKIQKKNSPTKSAKSSNSPISSHHYKTNENQSDIQLNNIIIRQNPI